MPFPSFFMANTLKAAGFPKSSGLLRRRRVVTAGMYDATVLQLTKLAIMLAIYRPNIAISLFADAFDDQQWSREVAVDRVRRVYEQLSVPVGQSPWATLSVLSSIGDPKKSMSPDDEIPWAKLGEPEFVTLYTVGFLKGIVWARLNQDQARTALEEDIQGSTEPWADLHAAGINLSEPPESVDEVLQHADTIVEAYITQSGPLPEAGILAVKEALQQMKESS